MSDADPFRPPLLIVGASVRAAAFSALRAGLSPVCADLFADLDLSARCPATAVSADAYPHTFSDVADALPRGPWMYTGALENHPDQVARLAARRPLWGNDAATLAAVRDPDRVSRCLAEVGVRHPACRTNPAGLPTDGTWLIKPIHSANGAGITPRVSATCVGRFYYQQRIDGTPCAALFVGDGTSATLLGVTRQLVGERALGAEPFTYCGSIGPVPLDADGHARFLTVGHALAQRFHLRGLFGVDCILREGVPWPVEVNPRYTASVEVIEYATGLSALALHRDACTGRVLRHPPSAVRHPQATVGKAVLYAPHDLIPPDLTGAARRHGVCELPRLADIPHPGRIIRKGSPMLTVFATAPLVPDCRKTLLRRAKRVYAACRRVRESVVVGEPVHG